MLHAAAMLAGLFAFWLVATQNWNSVEDFAVAGGVALACVVVAARFGGVSRSFMRAPQLLYVTVSRAPSVIAGALATLRAAAAADVTLKPALVRVKTRALRASGRAAFAGVVSATPGMAVVETDADGMLVHVMDEDAIDAVELGKIERLVMDATEARA